MLLLPALSTTLSRMAPVFANITALQVALPPSTVLTTLTPTPITTPSKNGEDVSRRYPIYVFWIVLALILFCAFCGCLTGVGEGAGKKKGRRYFSRSRRMISRHLTTKQG
jgi:hypothetical protein